MKKIFCFVLVLTMLLGMGAVASAEGDMRFIVSSAEAAPGEEVQITISIENNPGVAAVEPNLEYNEDVLEWTAATQGDYTGLWDLDITDPLKRLTWFGTGDNFYNDGLFCTLTFKVKEDAKAGDYEVNLTFKEDTVYNEDEFDVPFTVTAGMVTVTGSEEPEDMKFIVSSAEAAPGEEVQITISIENNPGIAAVEPNLEYNEDVLEWTAATQGDYTGLWDLDITDPLKRLTWFGTGDNFYNDGVFCTLTFKVKEDAKAGDYEVNLTFKEDTVYNEDEFDVPFTVEPGKVTVTGPVLGDGYYLIGQKGWTVDDIDPEQKFETNPKNTNEFLLETGLSVGDGIKVVKVEDGVITEWYPDGMDNQYVVDEAHAGLKTIYFHPWFDDAWNAFGGYMWIDAALTVRAEVYGSSISLKGDIALNFFLILPEELTGDADAYVKLNDAKIMIADASKRTVDGVGELYQFTIALNAKQMNDKVTLKVFNGEDAVVPLYRHSNGENVTETGYVYSVQDYIQTTLETSSNENLKALVQAMSDYGSLAQVYLDYNADDRAEVKGDLDSVTLDTLAAYAPKVTNGKVTGVTFIGPSLVLKTETALRLYFKLEEGEEIETFTFKVGKTVKEPTEASDGWMIEISNIAAKDLDKVYTTKVTTSAGTVVTVKASALSYAYNVLNSDKEETLKDLVKGLYLYNQAANAYFA